MYNVVALVGDNASVNKSIYEKTDIPFVKCALHRFNVAVCDILERDEILLSKLQSIMVKLRTLLLSAKLQKLTPLRPHLLQGTRWSSTFCKLNLYKELWEYLPLLQSNEIDVMSSSRVQDRRMDLLCARLGDL